MREAMRWPSAPRPPPSTLSWVPRLLPPGPRGEGRASHPSWSLGLGLGPMQAAGPGPQRRRSVCLGPDWGSVEPGAGRLGWAGVRADVRAGPPGNWPPNPRRLVDFAPSACSGEDQQMVPFSYSDTRLWTQVTSPFSSLVPRKLRTRSLLSDSAPSQTPLFIRWCPCGVRSHEDPFLQRDRPGLLFLSLPVGMQLQLFGKCSLWEVRLRESYRRPCRPESSLAPCSLRPQCLPQGCDP